MQSNSTGVKMLELTTTSGVESEATNSTYLYFHCTRYAINSSSSLPEGGDLRHIQVLCDGAVTQLYVIFSVGLAIGLPGSLLTLLTLAKMALSPSVVLLSLLSASDFLSLLLASLTSYHTAHLYVSHFLPRDIVILWTGRVFQVWAHWILTFICLERFVSVRFPLHKHVICTMRNTWLCLGVSLILSVIPLVLACLYYLGHVSTLFKYDMDLLLTIVYTLLYFILPGLSIVLFTALTAARLGRKREARSGANLLPAGPSQRLAKMEAQLTRMMFLAATCFIVLILPWAIFNTVDSILYFATTVSMCPLAEAVYGFAFSTTSSVSFLNHAINFYVYVIGARGFRHKFLNIVCYKRQPQEQAASDPSSSSLATTK